MASYTNNCNCEFGVPCDFGMRTNCKDWDNRFKNVSNIQNVLKPTFIIDHKCDKMVGCGSCFYTLDHVAFVEQIRDFILSNGIVELCEYSHQKWHRSEHCTMTKLVSLSGNFFFNERRVSDQIRTAILSGFYPFMESEDMWKYRAWINNLSLTITNGFLTFVLTARETDQGKAILLADCLRQIPPLPGHTSNREIHGGAFDFISNYLKFALLREIDVYTVASENSWKPSVWHRPGEQWQQKEWLDKIKANTTTEEEEKEALCCSACPNAGFAQGPNHGECGELDYMGTPLDTLPNKVFSSEVYPLWSRWTPPSV